VFGFDDAHFGGHAQFKTISENAGIAKIPGGIDFQTAAMMTEGAHYALGNIRAANVQAGQQVMVYGATGAIGSAAVQLLKYFGAEVTAVCPTAKVDLVRSLGADVVIDYTKEDITRLKNKFDLVFDAVGKSSWGACKPLLKDQGKYVSTELGKNAENVWKAILLSRSKGKRLLFPIPTTEQEDIRFLGELAQKGHFKPVFDRGYDLENIVEAYTYVETGQKTGNVVIRIPQD
jgi:NADPH:quinone reductase-like Zn-dependent oxidoreductase